jgi:hypothetical protein
VPSMCYRRSFLRKLLDRLSCQGYADFFLYDSGHNIASRRIIEKLAKETAVGEIEMGSEYLNWPAEKKVESRAAMSLSTTWTWAIQPDAGYELPRDLSQ